MAGRRIYLDHNATAPLLPEAREAMLSALGETGNPSSVHAEGRRMRAIVERARETVARLVGAAPEAVVFTSGASEAAATCLTPDWLRNGQPVRLGRAFVGATDHPCLLSGGRFDADQLARLPVDTDGRVTEATLAAVVAERDGVLVALSLANGETGAVADTDSPALAALAAGGAVVWDAAQAAGRLPIDIAALPASALILSGHKLGGPAGIGAYGLADPAFRPAPLVTGGAQQQGRRAGTEPVALIAGLGAAAEVATSRLASDGKALLDKRRRFEARLGAVPGLEILARGASRLPNTVTIAVDGLPAATLQMSLDLAGFAVSAGSACSSGKVGRSPVLAAMAAAGADIDAEAGAIRVSFGYETPADDLDAFVAALETTVRRQLARRREAAAA